MIKKYIQSAIYLLLSTWSLGAEQVWPFNLFSSHSCGCRFFLLGPYFMSADAMPSLSTQFLFDAHVNKFENLITCTHCCTGRFFYWTPIFFWSADTVLSGALIG